MSVQTGSGGSAGYAARLVAEVSAWARQLVRPPSQPGRAEAAQRLRRNAPLTLVGAGIVIFVLMMWVDVREIAMMPPRGTPGLWPFRILTDFGKDTFVLLLLIFVLLAVALAAPAVREPLCARLLDFGLRLQFVLLAVSVPLAIGELLKWVVGRGRPFVGGQADAFNFSHFHGTAAYESFPSGHAITAFALAFAVAAAWPRMRAVMIVYAAVIAFTRLVLLAHHPSDVLAGATIGIVGAMCVRYWFALRGLAFAVDSCGRISSLARGSKGVAEKASAS